MWHQRLDLSWLFAAVLLILFNNPMRLFQSGRSTHLTLAIILLLNFWIIRLLPWIHIVGSMEPQRSNENRIQSRLNGEKKNNHDTTNGMEGSHLRSKEQRKAVQYCISMVVLMTEKCKCVTTNTLVVRIWVRRRPLEVILCPSYCQMSSDDNYPRTHSTTQCDTI